MLLLLGIPPYGTRFSQDIYSRGRATRVCSLMREEESPFLPIRLLCATITLYLKSFCVY